MEGMLVQLDFSAAFVWVSYCGLLYKLRSIGVRGQFLPKVSQSLCDRKQRVRLDGKVSVLMNVVPGKIVF